MSVSSDFLIRLRKVLTLNAIFSFSSGVFGIVFATAVARLLNSPVPQIVTTSLSLIGFSVWLVWLSSRSQLPRGQAWIVAAMDSLWVVGTIVLLVFEVGIPAAGQWLLGLIGLVVGALALAQLQCLWKSSPKRPLSRRPA